VADRSIDLDRIFCCWLLLIQNSLLLAGVQILVQITRGQACQRSAATMAASASSLGRGSGLVVRRAAFDIGSGMTKMQVSDVDMRAGRIVATHFAEERQVLFAADWRHSGSQSELSAAIQEQVLVHPPTCPQHTSPHSILVADCTVC
jgi:hypothetical protein